MKTDEAPLYIHAYDLAKWLIRRGQRFPKSQRFVLALRIQNCALDLLDDVVLALVERDGRSARLHAADRSLTRLRLYLRLAHDLELLSDRQRDDSSRATGELGRMLGGWLRQLRDEPSQDHGPEGRPSRPGAGVARRRLER